ncbi:MAG: FHA domain-containing protein [Coriobacteriales bacterium]|jgi:hypothetical protein|nr:FHA domain-containing protein [Coriobacteriales bacterium]
MKDCPRCGSGVFDDMDTCFDCDYNFVSRGIQPLITSHEDSQIVRLKVTLAGKCAYETMLRKQDGAVASVGYAKDNTIVIPEQEVARHQCSIFYSQGQLWAEGLEDGVGASIDGMPLCKVRPLNLGDTIMIGSAKITLMQM